MGGKMYERIYAECISKGISIGDLEKKCGMAKNSLYKLNDDVKEPNPTSKTLKKLSKALDVSADYLLGTTDMKKTAEHMLSSDSFQLLQRMETLSPDKKSKAMKFFNDYWDTL